MRKITFLILLIAFCSLAACSQGADSEMMAEGQQYLEDDNYQGAIVIFKTILENSPENMEARFGLGKAYLRAGKLEQAGKNLEKYARQNPYDEELALEMGRLNIYQKNFPAGIESLNTYVEKNPESSDAYNLLGRANWGNGNYDQAKAYFAKALEVEPDLFDSRLALAQLLFLEQDLDQAMEMVNMVLEKDPKHHNALYLKARIAYATGDVQGYKNTFKYIAEVHPTDAFAKFTYGKSLLEDNEIDRANQIAQELQQIAPKLPYSKKLKGMVAYSQQQYKQAANAFHEAVTTRADAEGYFFLGMSLYGLGDLETAITQLRIAADRSAKFLKAREMICLILFQQGRINESVAEAEKVLKADPDNIIAQTILGDAYTAKGETSKAIEQLKKITEKEPLFAAAFLKMGALHYTQGDLGESEAALRGALNAAPDSVRPRLVLSDFYLRSGNKQLAREVLEEGLNGSKDDVALYSYLSRMALMGGEAEQAKELLAKAKAADEKSFAPYMVLASIHLSEKAPEAALEEYNALLEHHPDFLRAQLGKAVILDTLDRQDEADAAYKEGLTSGHPRAYMAYAVYKRKNNDIEGALAVLDEGLTKNANNRALTKVKAETLYSQERYEDVLAMANEIEKVQREAGLGLRVRTYILMDDYEKAIKVGRELTEFNPKAVGGYLILADVYRMAGQTDNWRLILEEGVTMSGPVPALLIEQAKYYSVSGDYNKALTYLDSVLKRNDKSFRAYAIQGDVYLKLGRTSKAVDSYNKALSLSDTYVPALNNLAMIYADDPKTAPESLRLAYKAYLQVPWNASIMDTFGYALAINGKHEDAITILEKASSLEPDNNEINYHLGLAYHLAGKDSQAVSTLKQVAECTDCESADSARRILKEINGE